MITPVDLPASVEHRESGKVLPLGIRVTSLTPITVYGLSRLQATTDAFLGLPTTALGRAYTVLAYENGVTSCCSGSEFSVLATEDGTTVTITPRRFDGVHESGVPYLVELDRGDVYLSSDVILGANQDVTGTKVTASRPVAVFGGHECANIPKSVTYCDHLAEQLPPEASWGRNFVTVPLATRTRGDTFRVVAATDGTAVTINGQQAAVLDAGDFYETVLTGASSITTSQPALVAQYSNGSSFDGVTSDPFMMLVPPYEQFLTRYTVATPDSGFATNYINVAATTAAVGSIQLDGAPVPASSFTPIGTSGLSGAQLPVARGTHNLSSSLPFGVFVYGFDSYDSYGYPGGLGAGSGGIEPAKTLVGLGDSVAAGEGLRYEWRWVLDKDGDDGHWIYTGHSDPPQWDCHRDPRAYPEIVGLALEYSVVHLACTGASAAYFVRKDDQEENNSANGILRQHVFWDAANTNKGTSPAQLGSSLPAPNGTPPYASPNPVYDNAAPDVVTLTMGANDVDFAGTLEYCYSALFIHCNGISGRNRGPYRSDRIDERIEAMGTALRTTLQEIERRGTTAGKIPLVALTTYFDPFPDPYVDCNDMTPRGINPGTTPLGHSIGLSEGEVAYLRGKHRAMNAMIRSVAKGYANVVVADMEDAFKDHQLCDDDPWVHGLGLVGEEHGKFDSDNYNKAPFHPTVKGQQVLAGRVAAAIRNSRYTPTGTAVTIGFTNDTRVTFQTVSTTGETVFVLQGGSPVLQAPRAAAKVAAEEEPPFGSIAPPTDVFNPRRLFEIVSSAAHSGPILISVPSDRDVPLWQYLEGSWRKVATTYAGGYVSGHVDRLSSFGLGEEVPAVSAAFTVSGPRVTPATLAFDGRGSSVVGGGAIASYAWDFDDGTVASGAQVEHTFDTIGSYRVRLSVTSAGGATSLSEQVIEVAAPPPTAVISPTPVLVRVGQPIDVNGAGSVAAGGATVDSFAWDFGDGGDPVFTPAAQHVYTAPGTYILRLDVTDDRGQEGFTTRNVEVKAVLTPTITCPSDLKPTLFGTRGNDVLTGTPGDDIIFGLGGKDVIHGLGGNDILCGNDGDDIIEGGDGDDWIYGGPGNDDLRGGPGQDLLHGEAGVDRLAGHEGDDRAFGGPGNDELVGGPGNDALFGDDGVDRLAGDDGDDELSGGQGNDRLDGGPGTNQIDGGAGINLCVPHGPPRPGC